MTNQRMRSHHEEIAKTKIREARRLLAEVSGLLHNDTMSNPDGGIAAQNPFRDIGDGADQLATQLDYLARRFPPLLWTT